MFPNDKIIEIFSMCDDFSKIFDDINQKNSIDSRESIHQKNRPYFPSLVLIADALLLGVPIVPARARIHRGHQHKRRWVLCRIFCPTDTNNPVLQRLPHDL